MLSVDQIYQDLGGPGGQGEGITYGLTEKNRLDGLLSTPNLWGHNPAVTDYIPAAQNLTQAIEELVASAVHSIDVSGLYPLPDGYFLTALSNGIQRAVAAGNAPVVRLVSGFYYPVQQPIDPVGDIDRFIAALGAPAEIPVYVAGMQTWLTSWNHSKLLIVDGKTAISGGHNYWSDDYTQFAPVHDVSLRLAGPAVKDAEGFLNRIWHHIATGNTDGGLLPLYWSRKGYQGQITDDALETIVSPEPPADGETKILAVARMGRNLEPASPEVPANDASQIARVTAVKMADNHVRLSQQMLGGSLIGVFDHEFLDAISQHVINGKQLTIVISDTGATTQSGGSYSGAGVEATAKVLAFWIWRLSSLHGQALIDLLAANVHIAPLRFYDRQPGDPAEKSWMWRRDGVEIEPANHAKVYIIDEDGFYFGSDNAYTMPLNTLGMQEYGFLVSGQQETREFVEEYWSKLWHYSSQFEFSEWSRIVPAILSNPEEAELLLQGRSAELEAAARTLNRIRPK